ncbi:MAG: Uma2 family endonuclease [Saprospiraceae bacterium]|nr:Uma2 family endonuclease [Saprospiraceae bacterium]
MITNINQLDFNQLYTYADYLTWQFSERVELLRGKIMLKMPAPSRMHQEISTKILLKIGQFLENSTCKLYHAPFDVRLPLPPHRIKSEKADTVVQPDICVICDVSKLDDKGCNGAPELVIEILSSSNGGREIKDKFDLYESAGVLEYWVVQPTGKFIIRYNLDETGKYIGSRFYTEDDIIESKVLQGFQIEINQIFGS